MEGTELEESMPGYKALQHCDRALVVAMLYVATEDRAKIGEQGWASGKGKAF